MSHFTVAVITKQTPTPELLDRVMAPYQEGGGEDGAFVRDSDVTDETRERYEAGTERRLKSPEGELRLPWDSEFYRVPTEEEVQKIGFLGGTGSGNGYRWDSRDWNDGLGYTTRIQYVPEGWIEVELKTSALVSFEQFVRDWHDYEGIKEGETPDYEDAHAYGYFVTNDAGEVIKVIRRYNPEGFWDWYEVGGRWSGSLRVLNPDEAVGGQDHWMAGKAPKDGYDVSRRRNLDIEAMRQANIDSRRQWINQIAGKAEVSLEVLEVMLRLLPQANAKWMELPEPRPRGPEYGAWIEQSMPEGETLRRILHATYDPPELKDGQSLEEFINDVRPLETHAVIRDGKWIQASRMGMFAVKHDETMPEDDWGQMAWKLVEETPADHWITIVDCHV